VGSQLGVQVVSVGIVSQREQRRTFEEGICELDAEQLEHDFKRRLVPVLRVAPRRQPLELLPAVKQALQEFRRWLIRALVLVAILMIVAFVALIAAIMRFGKLAAVPMVVICGVWLVNKAVQRLYSHIRDP
jgi:hypothetical protein